MVRSNHAAPNIDAFWCKRQEACILDELHEFVSEWSRRTGVVEINKRVVSFSDENIAVMAINFSSIAHAFRPLPQPRVNEPLGGLGPNERAVLEWSLDTFIPERPRTELPIAFDPDCLKASSAVRCQKRLDERKKLRQFTTYHLDSEFSGKVWQHTVFHHQSGAEVIRGYRLECDQAFVVVLKDWRKN